MVITTQVHTSQESRHYVLLRCRLKSLPLGHYSRFTTQANYGHHHSWFLGPGTSLLQWRCHFQKEMLCTAPRVGDLRQ